MIPIPLVWLRLPIAFVAAGFLAVYLYSRRTGQMLSLRSGARMGWITGIFSFTLGQYFVHLDDRWRSRARAAWPNRFEASCPPTMPAADSIHKP